MAIWPLYHRDWLVHCEMCEGLLGPAKRGECTEFGHGNGNYVFRCKCGWSMSYDITGSQSKASEYMKEHKKLFAENRSITINALAKQGRQFFQELRGKILGPPRVKKKPGNAFAMDTTSLITEESRKVKRKA